MAYSHKAFHAKDVFDAVCHSVAHNNSNVSILHPESAMTLIVSNRQDLFVKFNDLSRFELREGHHQRKESYICITFSKASFIFSQVLADVEANFRTEGMGPEGMGPINELPPCIFAQNEDTATFQFPVSPDGEFFDLCVSFMQCVAAAAIHALSSTISTPPSLHCSIA